MLHFIWIKLKVPTKLNNRPGYAGWLGYAG
jgi:hypothetical protein